MSRPFFGSIFIFGEKRSRKVRIRISEEAVEDRLDFDAAGRRLAKIVKERLPRFDPDHDHSVHESPPIEDWLISSAGPGIT